MWKTSCISWYFSDGEVLDIDFASLFLQKNRFIWDLLWLASRRCKPGKKAIFTTYRLYPIDRTLFWHLMHKTWGSRWSNNDMLYLQLLQTACTSHIPFSNTNKRNLPCYYYTKASARLEYAPNHYKLQNVKPANAGAMPCLHLIQPTPHCSTIVVVTAGFP